MPDPSAVLTSAPAVLADLSPWDWAVPAGVVVLVVALIGLVCWLRPYWPLRVLLWLVAHSLYWVRVVGRDNVPARGGALLVCNHVSYVDWLLLLASQRRFIRFVVWAGLTKKWGLRHLLRWAGCIPIDGAAGPRAIVKSLRTASDALARGELVCIFAEGRFTQTGLMLPFHRGFEQIVKHCKAPVIPVCLDQVWGSIFSFFGGRIFWKMPLEIPYHVTVAYGPPMPNDVKAADVRQAMQKLSADCAVARDARRVPVHRQFVRMASRHVFRPCMTTASPRGRCSLRRDADRRHVPGAGAAADAGRRPDGRRLDAAEHRRGRRQHRPGLAGQDVGQPQLHVRPRIRATRPCASAAASTCSPRSCSRTGSSWSRTRASS